MAYRLFIAIELPDGIKDQLIKLRSDIPGATWVKPHGYHLTLRFLGDRIETEKLQPIKDTLAEVASEPFTIQLRSVGRFPPNPKRGARVLWVGVSAPSVLGQLATQIERAVNKVGFVPEARDFNPHITLARLKSFETDPKVEQFLQAHQQFHTEPISVSEFHLISSVLSPQGAAYQTQATYHFHGS